MTTEEKNDMISEFMDGKYLTLNYNISMDKLYAVIMKISDRLIEGDELVNAANEVLDTPIGNPIEVHYEKVVRFIELYNKMK